MASTSSSSSLNASTARGAPSSTSPPPTPRQHQTSTSTSATNHERSSTRDAAVHSPSLHSARHALDNEQEIHPSGDVVENEDIEDNERQGEDEDDDGAPLRASALDVAANADADGIVDAGTPSATPPSFSVRVKHRKSRTWQSISFTTSVSDLQGQRFESVDAYVQFLDLIVRSSHPELLRMYHKEDKPAPAWDHILKLEVPQLNKSASLCTHVCSLCVEAQRPWQDCLVAVYYSAGRAKSANANSHMLNNHKEEWMALKAKNETNHGSKTQGARAAAPLASAGHSKRRRISADASQAQEEQRHHRDHMPDPPVTHTMSHVGLPIGSTSTLLRASSASTSLAQASRHRASVLSVPATRENKPSLMQASSTRLDKLAESPLGQILRARLISFIAQTGLDPSISNSSALHQLLSAAARLSIDFTPQILGMRHDDLTTEFARRLCTIKASLDRVRRTQQAEGLAGTSFSVQLHMGSAREPNAALLVTLSWIDVRCWEPLCVAISVNRPRVVALRRLDLLGLKSSHIHETRHTSAQEGHHLEAFVRKLLVDPRDDCKTSNATPRQDQAVNSVSNERDQDHDQDQDTREQDEPGLDEASNNSGIEAARALVAEAQVLWQRLTEDGALWAAIASQMASPWTSPLLSTSIGSSPWHLLQALLLEQAAIQNAVSTYEPPIDEDRLAQWLDDGWWAQLADLEAVLNAALSLQFAATVSPTSALVMLSLLRARFLLSQPRLGVIDGFDEERMRNAQDPRGLTFHRRDVACEVIDGFIDYLLPLDDGLTATSVEVGIGHLGFVAQALRERLVRELDRLVDDDQEFDQDHLIAMFCDPVFVSLGPRLMEMHPAYKNVFWRGLPLFERAFMQEFNRLGVDPGAAAFEDGNANTGNQGASVSAQEFHELQNTQGRQDSNSLHFEGTVPPSASPSDTQADKNTQAPSNFPRSETSRPIAMANWAPLTDNTVPDLLVSLASNSGVPLDDFVSLAPNNDELRRWLQLSVMWGTMHPTGTPLRDPFLASTRGAVFEFWRQHGAKFPTVQRLASRFLAMPAPLNMTPSLATFAGGAGEALSRSAEIQHLSKLSAQAVSALEPVTEISDALPREAFDLAHEFLGEDLCAPASSVADLTTMPFV